MSAGNRKPVSTAHIRERLAGTQLPASPLRVDVQAALQKWPQALLKKYSRRLQPAGVLVPIIDRGGELSVLLTQRSATLSQHAGQISFPGGRMEAGDTNVLATALRETYEEIGIAPELIDVAGFLEPSPTVSGFAVTPVIGFVAGGFRLRIDRAEVEQAFEVPLDFLMQQDNARLAEREVEGFRVPVVEFVYGERRIWGATARILVMLREKLT